MAVPKRRTSASKRNMRRAANEKIVAPNVIDCPNCSNPSLPHRVCPSCGYYNGRPVKIVEKAESDS
ncbi:MAG: 50S ribosomal protein L32 [Polyangiaceae bacterium]|nr:50S ribosomal protein L32 [Polyangiaceae bacterium]